MTENSFYQPTILLYGDSNTYGWHELEDGTIVRWPLEKTWGGRLAEALQGKARVVIDGLSGRISAFDRPPARGNGTGSMKGALLNGLTWLPAALSRVMPLDLLVIMLGTNDFNYQLNKTAAEATEGIRRLVEVTQEDISWRELTFYHAPQILLVAPPHIELVGTPNERFFPNGDAPSAEFAEHLRALAEEKGVSFFDAATVAPVAHDTDGVHLSLGDHEALAKGILPVIEELIENL